MIHTTVLDEFRTRSTVAILEKQQPYGDAWGGYVVKSYRVFPDEKTARAAFDEAKKIHRPRTKGASK